MDAGFGMCFPDEGEVGKKGFPTATGADAVAGLLGVPVPASSGVEPSMEYVTRICRVVALGLRMVMFTSPDPTPSFCRDSESAEDN
jgi:hypothetical protein